jgi:hypothetical protein
LQALAELKGFGRLLAGVGKSLRMYDLGKKKLLKKCENRNFPSKPYSIFSPPSNHKVLDH